MARFGFRAASSLISVGMRVCLFILFCSRRKTFLPLKGGRCSYKAPINYECVHAVMVLISAPKTLRQTKTDTLFKGD